MTARELSIGIAWQSFGSPNLGVRALAESNLAIIRDALAQAGASARFVSYCSDANQNQFLPSDVREGPQFRLKRWPLGGHAFRTDVRRCDVLIDIGEGDSFSDIYGFKRFALLTASKDAAIGQRVPLILAPQTIGPFSGRIARQWATWTMNRASMIFARDEASAQYAEALGVRQNIHRACDVAFRLPYRRVDRGLADKLRLGLNISALLYHGGYTDNNQFDLRCNYRDLTHSVLDWLTNDPSLEIHLVGHVNDASNPVENDHALALRLGTMYPGLKIAPPFESPSEAKTCISQFDVFIGARMHACIAAVSSGVATLPMAYSRKFNGLFDSISYKHLVDLKQDTLPVILAKIEGLLRKHDEAADDAGRSSRIALDRLGGYCERLTQVFSDLLRSSI